MFHLSSPSLLPLASAVLVLVVSATDMPCLRFTSSQRLLAGVRALTVCPSGIDRLYRPNMLLSSPNWQNRLCYWLINHVTSVEPPMTMICKAGVQCCSDAYSFLALVKS